LPHVVDLPASTWPIKTTFMCSRSSCTLNSLAADFFLVAPPSSLASSAAAEAEDAATGDEAAAARSHENKKTRKISRSD
jgi:hypothetical protein